MTPKRTKEQLRIEARKRAREKMLAEAPKINQEKEDNENNGEDTKAPAAKRQKKTAPATATTSAAAKTKGLSPKKHMDPAMLARIKEFVAKDKKDIIERATGTNARRTPATTKTAPATAPKMTPKTTSRPAMSATPSRHTPAQVGSPARPRNDPPPQDRQKDTDYEEEHEEEEPEDELKQQRLNQRVVANADAYTRGAPTNDDPPTGDEVDYDIRLHKFEEPHVEHVEHVENKQNQSKRSLFLSVTVSLLALASLYYIGIAVDFGFLPALSGSPRCYLDSATGLGCEDISPRHSDPCPSGGICEGGKLVACSKLFHQINPSGTACKLSSDKQKFHDTMVKALKSTSMDGRGCEEIPWPYIEYSELQRVADSPILIEPSQELADVLAHDGFGVEWEEAALKLQLPKEYQHKPSKCKMQDGVKTFLEWLGNMLVDTLVVFAAISLTFIWEILNMATQSKVNFIGFMGVLLVFVWYKRREQTKKKKLAVVNGVGMVLAKLHKSNGQAIRADLVMDELAQELFPHASHKQKDWKNTAWPAIKKEISKDKGVLSTHIVSSGKPVLAWKSVRQTTFAN